VSSESLSDNVKNESTSWVQDSDVFYNNYAKVLTNREKEESPYSEIQKEITVLKV